MDTGTVDQGSLGSCVRKNQTVTIAKNTFTWNGQIYAGGPSDAMNNPSFTFVPMGAAGVDFDTATPTQTITKPQPGGLVTQRDLSVG